MLSRYSNARDRLQLESEVSRLSQLHRCVVREIRRRCWRPTRPDLVISDKFHRLSFVHLISSIYSTNASLCFFLFRRLPPLPFSLSKSTYSNVRLCRIGGNDSYYEDVLNNVNGYVAMNETIIALRFFFF